jgi:DNA-binding CsgD family transcriptional regulator
MQAGPPSPTPTAGPQVSDCLLRAIDLLDIGIAVVGHDGRIAYANRTAAALLRQRNTLRGDTPAAGQSRPVAAAIDQQIRTAIKRGRDERYFSLPMADGRSLFLLSVPCGRSDERPRDQAANILFLTEPSRRLLRDLSAIAPHYKLTRAETRLLQALVRGDTIGTYAKRAGITLNTAKGYLKQLFRKTSTARQSNLVRLILANPVLHLVVAEAPADGGHNA